MRIAAAMAAGRVAAGALALELLAGCGMAPVPVSLEITHDFDGAPLSLGDDAPDAPGVRVTRLSYYLGRVRLQRDDGRWFATAQADSAAGDYHLVEGADAATHRFVAIDVPPGRYRAVEFLLGVDPAHNAAGPQSGALDPAHGMFWTWKTGYVYFAIEGRSARSPEPKGALTYHIGGDARLARTLVLPLPGSMDARSGHHPEVHLRADLGAVFDGLPIEQVHTVMENGPAALVADRWATAFRVDHVHAGEPADAS